MKQNREPEVVTFGCRLNAYESEVMRNHARNAGLDDVVIFNSCAVTKEAERQVRQAIRRSHKENPDRKIIVTGCAAQIDPESFASMEEVDQVVGNDLKMEADTWQFSKNVYGKEKIIVNDIMSIRETAAHLVEGYEGKSRAFVQVQQGCDHRCTFCIIPFGRGNSRSVPVGQISEQVKALVAGGYNEIVMTGVDITSYGSDLPGKPTLGQMIRRVLALVPELPRLRLSSIDPVEIDEDLWGLIEREPRFMPHLHLSVQAGDDMILKRMKRRHSRQDVIDVCNKARNLRPDIAFGADLIAGFPTETDEMFQNTLELVRECGFAFLHVFPYSERDGTPAARMPQVEKKIRKQRAAALRDEGAIQLRKLLTNNINKNMQAVVEKGRSARIDNFIMVELDKEMPSGSLVDIKTKRVDDSVLMADVITA
jgi:threonylcarbamoyladenosine tRNA methylthiotransferase MtaB